MLADFSRAFSFPGRSSEAEAEVFGRARSEGEALAKFSWEFSRPARGGRGDCEMEEEEEGGEEEEEDGRTLPTRQGAAPLGTERWRRGAEHSRHNPSCN